jgi:hypothetical protein
MTTYTITESQRQQLLDLAMPVVSTPNRIALKMLQSLTPNSGEAVGFMWQHEDTGRIGFADMGQKPMWKKGNPRLKIIKDIFTAPSTKPADARCCNHDSDCAVHNMPAYPAGPCDCSMKTESVVPSEGQLHEGIKALLLCGNSEIESLSPLMYETYTDDVRRVYVAMCAPQGETE